MAQFTYTLCDIQDISVHSPIGIKAMSLQAALAMANIVTSFWNTGQWSRHNGVLS